MPKHSYIVGSANHVIHAFTYADAAARTGAIGLVTADIGKVAKQSDDDSFWLLTATTPAWGHVAVAGGGYADIAGPSSAVDNALARFSGTTGKIVKNSGAILDDLNNLTIPGSLTLPGTTSKVGVGTVSPEEVLHIDNGNILLDRGNLRFRKEPSPAAPTVAVNVTAGNLNGFYTYRITLVTDSGETQEGATSVIVNPVNQQVDLSVMPIGTAAVTSRKIYRTVASGSQHKLVTTINDNTTTIFTDNVADGSLGVDGPTVNDTSGQLIVAGVGSINVDQIKNHIVALDVLTAGSIPFASGTKLIEDNANLFWDDTNNRLGIGSTAPKARLQVGTDDNGDLLNLNSERAWTFGSSGSGSATKLTLRPDADNKSFEILSLDQVNLVASFLAHTTADLNRVGLVRNGGSVGIGTAFPDLSTVLEVRSTTKGSVVAPRMTGAQRDAIPSPIAGLEVFNLDTNRKNIYDGTSWRVVSFV